MFVIRGKDLIFENTEQGFQDKEITYSTYEEAETALESLQLFVTEKLSIVELDTEE
jgi:hypothetical protein